MSVETKLTKHLLSEIERLRKRFPEDQERSAVIGALHAAQHDNQGYLTTGIMDAVALELNMHPMEVYEIATFYSMFNTQPVGRHNVAICTNISCMLRGAEEIVEHVERKLGVETGASTDDGRIFLKREEECLAACCDAPMMMVDHRYYENLTKPRTVIVAKQSDQTRLLLAYLTRHRAYPVRWVVCSGCAIHA